MKRFSDLLKDFFSTNTFLRKICKRKLLCAFSSVILLIGFCSHENLIEKIQDYNTPAPELYYFNVVSTDPITSATDIPINADIHAVFDDNISMPSITSSTFSVYNGSVYISGVFTYNSQSKTVTFNPDSDMAPDTLHTVILTTGIKNVTGETMFTEYSWSFTTAGASEPEIYITSPLYDLNSGDTLDFGTILNGSSYPVILTVENTGTGLLDLNSLVLSGINSDQFTVTVDPTPVTVNPGLNTPFTIEFMPTSSGIKNAILTINNTDADEGAFVVNLTGNSVLTAAPEIQITYIGIIIVSSVTVVNFGTTPVGGSQSIEFIMSNIGSADMNITDCAIAGSDPAFYSTDFSFPVTITAGSTISFNITFSPGSKGNKKADIVFQSNDSDESPFIIKVKGRGN